MRFFKNLTTATALSAIAIFVSGCVEQSTVVKVKKDGSGVVHIRLHVQEKSSGMFDSEKNKAIDHNVPSSKRIEEIRKSLGADVRLVTAEASVNRSGWRGYDLIYEFDNISKVKISHEIAELLTPKDEGEKEDSDKKNKTSSIDVDFQFAMKDGVLEIQSSGFAEPATAKNGAAKIERAVDPYAKEDKAGPATMDFTGALGAQIAAQVLADAKIGTFVQIEGGIADSNALYLDENLITLMSMKPGKLLAESPGNTLFTKVDQKITRERLQELTDGLKAISIDTQNPITVSWE